MSPNGVTPEEHELPDIISVDDHVLEPKDLWQEQLPRLPARAWPQGGPREGEALVQGRPLRLRARRRGRRAGATSGSSTTWSCPPGCCTPPAGSPSTSSATSPPSTRTSAPAPTTRRRASPTWTVNHVEAAINYPNIFPRFAGQGFAERADKDLALACLQHLQRLDDRRLVRRRRQGSPDPAHARPAVGPGARGRRGAALRGQGQLRDRVQREPVEARLRRRCTPASGTSLWEACVETDTTVSMHIGSSSSMPTTLRDAPLAVSMSLNAQNAQGSLCRLGVLGHAPALPRPQASPTPRARSAGCRSSSSAWTACGATARGGVERHRRRRASR